jgi:hypothetical protein
LTGSSNLASFSLLIRIVGFEDLGNTDNFSTARLEYRLIQSGMILLRLFSLFLGVISRPRVAGQPKATTILGFTGSKSEYDSDLDSDYD